MNISLTAKNEVTETTWPQTTFMTSRGTRSIDSLAAFFGEKYGALYGALARGGIAVDQPPCAIYYSVDEKTMIADLAAAVPVPENTPEIEGFTKVVFPATKVLMVTHYGPYSQMTETYSLLEKYLNEHHLKRTWIIEQYLSDPESEPDQTRWKTNIYFGFEQSTAALN